MAIMHLSLYLGLARVYDSCSELQPVQYNSWFGHWQRLAFGASSRGLFNTGILQTPLQLHCRVLYGMSTLLAAYLALAKENPPTRPDRNFRKPPEIAAMRTVRCRVAK